VLVIAAACLAAGGQPHAHPQAKSAAPSQAATALDPPPGKFFMESLPPDLDPVVMLPVEPVLPTEPGATDRAILPDTLKLWPNGYTIKISFLNGTPEARKRVASVASDWTQFANLRFDFGQSQRPDQPPDPSRDCRMYAPGDDSIVRVTFGPGGNWSAVGNDCVNVTDPPGRPTMSVVDALYDTLYGRFVILHEFGHVVGFGHEHQNPQVDCGYNFDVLRAELNWDDAKLKRNMARLDYFLNPRAVATKHDEKSVMHYSFPARFFRKPDSPCHVDLNRELSQLDRETASAYYPKVQSRDLASDAKRALDISDALDKAPPGVKVPLRARLKIYLDDRDIRTEYERLKDLRGGQD
jgi:hypothetical protein